MMCRADVSTSLVPTVEKHTQSVDPNEGKRKGRSLMASQQASTGRSRFLLALDEERTRGLNNPRAKGGLAVLRGTRQTC